MGRLKYFLMAIVMAVLLLPATSVKAETVTINGYEFKEGVTYGEQQKATDKSKSDTRWGYALGSKYTNYVGWFECDKKASSNSSAKWYTKGYVPTANKIQGYTLPDKTSKNYVEWRLNGDNNTGDDISVAGWGIAGTKSTIGEHKEDNQIMTHTLHALNVNMLEEWADKADVKPDKEGVRTIYLQPIIGVKDRQGNGSYKPTGTDYRSWNDWKTARGWSNPSTYKSHYNIPVRFKKTAEVTVEYVTNADGDGYKKGDTILEYSIANGGGVATLPTEGIKYALDDKKTFKNKNGDDLRIREKLIGQTSKTKGKEFVLVGVTINNEDYDLNCDGTFVLNVKAKNNVITPGKYNAKETKSSFVRDNSGNKLNTSGKFAIDTDGSGVDDRLTRYTYQLFDKYKITYRYAEKARTINLQCLQ